MTLTRLAAVLSFGLFCTAATAQAPLSPEAMPPLMPRVECDAGVCEISFTGVFDGKSLSSQPLPMPYTVESAPAWQPRILSDEALKIDGTKAPYGWRLGSSESEMDIYLTPLTEFGMEGTPLLFMIEQFAGSEHVGVATQFLSVNYDDTELTTARLFAPSAGPQTRVTSADTAGVRTMYKQFNPETDEFEPTYDYYEWYSGATAPMLASAAEMEQINAETDRLSNVLETLE